MKSRIDKLYPLIQPDQGRIEKILKGFEDSPDTYEARAGLWQALGSLLCDLKIPFEQQHIVYQQIFEDDAVPPAWMPDAATQSQTHLGKAIREKGLEGYAEFFQWAAENRSDFWQYTLSKLNITFRQKPQHVRHPQGTDEHPGWLAGARYNVAESCFLAPADQIAVRFAVEGERGIQEVSYEELERQTNRLANGLLENGYQAGDAAVLYMPMCYEAVFIYLGMIKAGIKATLIADSFTAGELRRRADLAGATLVFCTDGYLSGNKNLEIYSKVREAGLEKAVVVPYHQQEAPRLSGDDVLLEAFLSGKTSFEAVPADPYDITAILFSSGTTKEPKAIPWTHLTPIKCASDAYYHHDVHPGDVVTWTTSMGWMMGPWVIFAALMNGATLALYTGLAAGSQYGQFVQDSGMTILGTIPSLVKVWRKNRIMRDFDWKVRVFSSTGEPSNAEDYLYLMSLAHYRAPVIEYCGGTEIGGGYLTGSLLQPASPATFTTPALGLDFVLADEGGNVSREHNEGQVMLIPPSIGMSERLLNRDHHEEYFAETPLLDQKQLLRRHGDAWEKIKVKGHESTYVFYRSKGRVDDAMNLGGVKVSAVEIEGLLNRHEHIREVAAVAIPQEKGGPEKLVVFACLTGEATPEARELRQTFSKILATELNPLFKVSEVIFRDPLPRTASNKLMRRALRADYEASTRQ